MKAISKTFCEHLFFPAFVVIIMVINFTASDNASVHQELDVCKLFLAVFYSIIFGTICLLGLVGNTISFVVLRLDSSMPVASFQLRSLAVADNIFLILWMVHYSFRYTLQYIGLRSNGIGNSLWLCIRVYTFPLMYMAQTSTIWFTVALGLSRYLAICTPYGARKLCSMVCIRRATYTITAFSIAYNLPRYFEIEVYQSEKAYLDWKRTSLGVNALYKLIYTDVLYCAVTFIVPLVSLAFMNTKVIASYRQISRRRSRIVSKSQAASNDNECSITLVMIIIVVVFIACHLPARFIQMLYSYRFSDCRQAMYYWIHVSNVLEVLNSSVNFVIYWASHKQFRRILPFSHCCRSLGETSGILPHDPASHGDPKNGRTSEYYCMIFLAGQETHLNTGASCGGTAEV